MPGLNIGFIIYQSLIPAEMLADYRRHDKNEIRDADEGQMPATG